MIEIKVDNYQDHSRLIVNSGNRTVMSLKVPKPINQDTYYRQVAPILAPLIRNDESYLYVGKERLRVTVDPLTGFMSSGGRGIVDIISNIQEGPSNAEDEKWKPANILNTIISVSKEVQDTIKEQIGTLEQKDKSLLEDKEAFDLEEEHRKLEKEILGDERNQKTMTPLEAARKRAAKTRKSV